jgi:hypothetical protein
MNFISLNSNWKFELNRSIEKQKEALFLWVKTGQPNSETWLLPPFPLPIAHWTIPSTTGDEVGQGVAGEEAWTKGDHWEVVGRTQAHRRGLSTARQLAATGGCRRWLRPVVVRVELGVGKHRRTTRKLAVQSVNSEEVEARWPMATRSWRKKWPEVVSYSMLWPAA